MLTSHLYNDEFWISFSWTLKFVNKFFFLGGDIYPYLIEHMKEFYPGYSYQDLAPLLTAKYFNATDFANIVEDSGAK